MDNILNQIEHRFSYNSIVIGVLRSAMDKTHEKLQSKYDGPIEFLHERSKFYELSAILVESVLNIMQEEIDIIKNNGETIRLDLMEIEHWLQGRVKQTKSSLVEKDKELKDKIENELRLKEALDLKEKELIYLREKLEAEQSKRENEAEDFDESIIFSIDQHEHNRDDIIQDEEFSVFDSERAEQNEVIQQMSSDINILIGTLDYTFGRMHKAQILPLEKKWKCAIEKDIVSMFIRGFLKDIKQKIEVKMEGTTFLNHSSTMNEEIRNLIQERDCENSKNVIVDKKASMSDSPIKLKRDIESLRQQCDDQRVETFFLEEIYQLLFQGLSEGLCSIKDGLINRECLGNRFLEEGGIVRNESINLSKNPLSMKMAKTSASCISLQKLETLKGLLKVDVCMVYLTEMARTWRMEIDAYHLENLLREDIYQFVVMEMAKGDQNKLSKNMHSSENTYVDEHEIHNSKRQEDNNDSRHRHQRERSQYVHVKNSNFAMKIACTDSVLLPHIDLDQLVNNFEKIVQDKVERNSLRMVDLKHQMLELVTLVVSLRKENSLYKKAFLHRCKNLALAEAEVDLLGDQVDRTGNMLKTAYQLLDQNSSSLSNYNEVSDLMKLINNELALV
ncbi:hypothetical protein LIER_32670 [Lithospermum erythrorhizon]|uniref:WPP domain-associated protein n=1 Tax=Lithospermum erythrorhizon TaxID=34254 RepID=A0AAV3RYE1_LITER